MYIKRLLIGLFLLFNTSAFAADSTVAALTAASALGGTELFYCVQGSSDRKCTATQLGTFVLASPTITGTAVIPTPFTLGAISVTSTGTQLNYLNAVTGTTGTTSTNLVFSGSPSIASLTVTGAFTATGLVTNAALANPATTVNGQTCTLGSTCTVTASASAITVGTTTVGSGTTTRILYDNAGTLGEYTLTGTGTVVAMQTSPTFVTDLTTPIAKLSGTSNQLVFQSGGITGTLSWAPATSNKTITLPNGTTDFTGTSGIVQQTSSGAAFTVGSVALSNLATQATNTIVGNATSGTAVPTALAIGTCSTAASAVIWTTNSGFGCNTSITANAVAVGGITGLGTGVATALAVNVGSAGAPVTFNGAGGTPSSMTATNLSGTAASLTAGNVTTNANLTGVITSVGNATSIASQTGTGTKFVVDTTPTLITPVLGVATATSINFGGSTLSTYTVGTWTPTLIGSAVAGTGQTYSAQTGSYEQIGRTVFVRFTITATSLGTATGNLLIGGLPVTILNSANENAPCVITFYAVNGLAALNYGLSGFGSINTTSINLYSNSNTGSAALTVTQAGSSAFFIGSCNYRAS